jgi:hypothetical protein
MLWIVRLKIRLILRVLPLAIATLAGAAAVILVQLRREQADWGTVPADTVRDLPGDDLVPGATIVDTRSLLIDAPPSAVWPWLVQMGYGRGGWYSYDRMDMKGRSAERILPEYQDLAPGDLVPTHSEGGFLARVVEPQRALVLYLDDQLVGSQAASAGPGSGASGGQVAAGERPIPGLQAAGAISGLAMPRFSVSWAIVLHEEGAGSRTRLIERFRVNAPDAGLPSRLGMPLMGLGVFAMTRRHMLGLKERAERTPAAG